MTGIQNNFGPNLVKEMQQIKVQIYSLQSRDIIKVLLFVEQKYYEVKQTNNIIGLKTKKATIRDNHLQDKKPS